MMMFMPKLAIRLSALSASKELEASCSTPDHMFAVANVSNSTVMRAYSKVH